MLAPSSNGELVGLGQEREQPSGIDRAGHGHTVIGNPTPSGPGYTWTVWCGRWTLMRRPGHSHVCAGGVGIGVDREEYLQREILGLCLMLIPRLAQMGGRGTGGLAM